MRSIILAVGLVTILGAGNAAALSIDTTSSSGGTAEPFGWPMFATFGQTFTVSGPDTQLDSFSLYLNSELLTGPGTLDFRGYLASWDSVNVHASSILFESATANWQSLGLPGPFPPLEFAFSPAGLALTAGQQYVAFLSIANLQVGDPVFDQLLNPQNTLFTSDTVRMPLAGSVLSGGEFVYQNTGFNFSELTSSTWGTSGTGGIPNGTDAWFKASLSRPTTAVPEPSSLLLLGIGLVGLVAWRWKRAA